MTRFHGKSRRAGQRAIPPLWLMTDERVAEADLLRAIRRLPSDAAVIVRHYGLAETERRALFDRMCKAARRQGLRVLLAGEADKARQWGADGHHGRAPARPGIPGWLHSAPVHNHRERIAAERAGADMLLISPLFATRSHPGARPLGPARFAALARAAGRPVIALGGVRPGHAGLVRRLGAAGIAAIDGLIRRNGERSAR